MSTRDSDILPADSEVHTGSAHQQTTVTTGHGMLCTCVTCIGTKRIGEEAADRWKHALASTMVNRKGVEASRSPGVSLMTADEALSIVPTGIEVPLDEVTGIELDPTRVVTRDMVSQVKTPPRFMVHAKWYNKDERPAEADRGASVFGALGSFILDFSDPTLSIPKVNALAVPPQFLAYYGATLIPVTETAKLEKSEFEQLYMIQYTFKPEYIEDYVMHINGGGGLFVETHPFPHLFTPMSPECSGAIILGVPVGPSEFSFTAFEIPYGYTLHVNSNVIHGDSFFVGPYAIALVETDKADSVLMRTPQEELQYVEQYYSGTRLSYDALLLNHALSESCNTSMFQRMCDVWSKGLQALFQSVTADGAEDTASTSLVETGTQHSTPLSLMWQPVTKAKSTVQIEEIPADEYTDGLGLD